MIRAVQAAFWRAAIIIAITTIVVLYFDFSGPQRIMHPHALPESIDLDSLFDDFRTDGNVHAATTFDSVADLETLAKVCAAGASFWTDLRPVTLPVYLSIACTSIPRVKELSGSFNANNLAGVDKSELESLLQRILEMGYGENPTTSIRNIVYGALDGHDAFEHHEFLDLGCGRGKVLAVACTQLDRSGDRFSFERCHGVEYVEKRFDSAHGVHAVLQQALRNASDPELADRLASVVHVEQGDVRSVELASRLFPRASVIYMYNTLFGAHLDDAIARLIAKYARSRTRIMFHTLHDEAWPSEQFRLLRVFDRSELVWTTMFLMELK
jgi:hypothetical protein